MRRYVSIPLAEVRAHYGSGEGRHWFDRSTLRFWGSILPRTAYANNTKELAYFVTAENKPFGREPGKLYSVRQYDFRTREISTVGTGGFQAFHDRESAVREAKALAEWQQVLP